MEEKKMSVLADLQPTRVFYYFEEICNIPHGSRNTKAISDYIVDFAKGHRLEYIQDELNNVIIFKPASPGYETSEPVIIQGHMDMVCEKDKGVDIDFEKDGLRLMVDGDFVTAEGTTLGGDDGIAVAFALALLEDDSLQHPRLEVVLTVDEEIGMLGAYDIDLSMLQGRKMLNLDSDEEGHFLTGCAGGMSLNVDLPVHYVVQKGLELRINVTGLEGGHSGAEIHKEHGNADIIMGRILQTVMDHTPMGIVRLAGGLKDNAIPRECTTKLLIPEESQNMVEKLLGKLNTTIKNELSVADPNFELEYSFGNVIEGKMLDYASVNRVVYYLRTVPNGVQHMSQVMSGMVETSLNLGIMELTNESLHTVTSLRSSVSSRKEDLKNRVCNIVEMLGGEYAIEGDYPAWEYKKDSVVRETIGQIYEELSGEKPVFEAIHAGLECGIFSEKIPDLDCVSFGPANFDIHTPKERLSISSTQRYYQLVTEFLKRSK